ncbi:hypothetical protein L218DRAFT_737791 [Marasmius fiardii PR-910]|nr:hypothetical protein L218DRAFT_737791 [Marasmius fiardii PR-910]
MKFLAKESPENALQVLRFKVIYSYLDGIDKIAPLTVSLPVLHVLQSFGDDHLKDFTLWLKYQQAWHNGPATQYTNALNAIPTEKKEKHGKDGSCPSSTLMIKNCIAKIDAERPTLKSFDDAAWACQSRVPACCCRVFWRWHDNVHRVLQSLSFPSLHDVTGQ